MFRTVEMEGHIDNLVTSTFAIADQTLAYDPGLAIVGLTRFIAQVDPRAQRFPTALALGIHPVHVSPTAAAPAAQGSA